MTKSKIFLFLLLAFTAGVSLRSFIPVSYILVGLCFMAAAAAITIGIFRRHKSIIIYGFLFLSLLSGIMRFDWINSSQPDLSDFYGKPIQISGYVIEEPKASVSSQRIKLEVESIDGKPISPFRVLVVSRRYPEYRLGDELEISGLLEEPENFGEFDYISYLAKDEIFATISFPLIEKIGEGGGSKIKLILSKIKNSFEEKLEKSLPEPHASFMKGLLLGERESLPDELVENFKKTGVSHIVALSGYNITLVGGFLMTILIAITLPFNLSFWIATFSIVLFVILTGASPSVVRAGIMGLLVLIAQKEGRMYRMTNALVFAGAVMVFHNPKILRFDAAFQLSFLATAGLIYLAPYIENLFERARTKLTKKVLPLDRDERFSLFPLKRILIETLSAQIMVLPLLIYLFGRVSLVSPLTNLLVITAVPYSMFFGFIAGLAGFIWEPLGQIAGWGAWVLLEYKIRVIEFFARVPGAYVETGKWAGPLIVIFYLYLFYKVRAWERFRKTQN